MKRTYITPEERVRKITIKAMMATSPSSTSILYGGDNNFDDAPVEAETKRESLWDSLW